MLGAVITLFSFRSYTSVSVIHIPESWPKPVYDFENNPVTEKGFQLGRRLFYDTKLSIDSTISCANCHLQFTGFTHVDHKLSHGIKGRKGTRNSPALINLAWNNSFHWDGGVNHLNAQPINPIQHPAEMGNTLENVLEYLNNSSQYRQWFHETFQDSVVTTKLFLSALTQYTVSLVSANSKYDQYLLGKIGFSDQEKNGLALFQQYCNTCHKAPLFNTNEYLSNGLPIDTRLNDVGRYAITNTPNDSLKFRVPTLRNIERTFPYMHDGRFIKLKDVINYYCDDLDQENRYLDPRLKTPIEMTPNERKDLLAFLYTLTDIEFLFNPRFGFPR